MLAGKWPRSEVHLVEPQREKQRSDKKKREAWCEELPALRFSTIAFARQLSERLEEAGTKTFRDSPARSSPNYKDKDLKRKRNDD